MRIAYVIPLFVHAIVSCATADESPTSRLLATPQEKIAFLLGTADRFGRIGPGGFTSPELTALFEIERRDLALQLGYLAEDTGSNVDVPKWQEKVAALLTPVSMPLFESEEWVAVRDGRLPAGWDERTRWAYLLGTYCSAGQDEYIGYFSTRRAFFVVALLRSFQDPDESSLEVSTLFGYIPGGSRITLPKHDPVYRRLVADSRSLLAREKEAEPGATDNPDAAQPSREDF